MTINNNKSETCDSCNSDTQLKDFKGHLLCPLCKGLAETVSTNPDLLSRVTLLLQTNKEEKHIEELPEVLDAVRYRTRDRELNTWYVSVSELQGNPVEIFASTAFDRDQHLQSRISNLTTITRLISLILRHIFLDEKITLKKTLKQLHRSSRQKNDLPDMLTRVLSKYS